jgi:WD40 repeat protein
MFRKMEIDESTQKKIYEEIAISLINNNLDLSYLYLNENDFESVFKKLASDESLKESIVFKLDEIFEKKHNEIIKIYNEIKNQRSKGNKNKTSEKKYRELYKDNKDSKEKINKIVEIVNELQGEELIDFLLYNVRSINLSNNFLEDFQFLAKHFTCLKEIYASNNRIKIENLKDFKGLEVLDVSNNGINSIEFVATSENLFTLIVIDYNCNEEDLNFLRAKTPVIAVKFGENEFEFSELEKKAGRDLSKIPKIPNLSEGYEEQRPTFRRRSI